MEQDSRGHDQTPPPAVLLGAGTTALSMARSLRARDVRVLVIDSERTSLSSHSRIFEFVRYAGVYSEEVVGFLEELASSFGERPVLMPSGDEHVAILSRHRERLAGCYSLNLPPPDVTDVLLDKEDFGQLARQRGWPIPHTVLCESLEDAERAAAQLPFPAVLKPRLKNRATRENSPRKAFLCDTPAELVASYRLLAQWEKEAIAQEWIPGGDAQIVFSLHYIDRTGRDLVSFEGRKIRQYLPECGSTSNALPIDAEDVRELATRILIESGARGYCSVEFKRDPRTGDLRIMEPTIGRPNLQVGLSAANGIDIVYAGYCDMAGLPLPVMKRAERPVRWVLLPHDIRSAMYYIRRGSLSWADYVRSMSPPLHVLPWSAGDYPLVAAAAKRLGRSIRRRFS
jgi:D-aspartate ligase